MCLVKTIKNESKQPDNPNHCAEVNGTEEIFELLLEQNTKILVKAKNGITANGPLGKMLGPNTENKTLAQENLNNTIPKLTQCHKK